MLTSEDSRIGWGLSSDMDQNAMTMTDNSIQDICLKGSQLAAGGRMVRCVHIHQSERRMDRKLL